MSFQQTIQNAVSLSGVGLHTGQAAQITFKPAPENHGYQFQRIDLPNQPIIKADANLVTSTARSTSIEKGGVSISTTEHVLAALVGLQIDNVLIELNNQEVPILDGSATPFIVALQEAGIETQARERAVFTLTEPIRFYDEEKEVEIIAIPAEKFEATVMIDFDSSVLGKQHASLKNLADFSTEIASARTFCFLHELEYMAKNDLIKGGDLSNAIVFANEPMEAEELQNLANLLGKETVEIRPEGYLNNVALRYDNEPARHKLLDLIGDLALIGTRINAKIIATKPGHAANVGFAKLLKAHIKKQKGLPPVYDFLAPPVYDINKIIDTLPHRFPFLLVDKILELTDKKVAGIKNVTYNERFFQGHFPGFPIMPGVLIIEAMAQAGGILALNSVPDPENYLTFFLKMDKVKFRTSVHPGDTLLFVLELVRPIRRGLIEMKAVTYVGHKVAVEGIFTAQIRRRT